MISDLIDFFKDKKILILGFGREGKSTYKLIRKYLNEQVLYIADKDENFEKNDKFLQQDKNVVCNSGENYLENLNEYDVIMKAPGISFVGLDTKGYISRVKSQLELLLEFFNVRTIGITGTKGKSTTTSLVYKILEEQNVKSMLLGNIGVPVFDYIDCIQDDMTIVLEMSSHQLEFMKKSTNISILLNVFEEHLDHYDSFERYIEAKCNIFKYQSNSDYFLYNFDNDNLNKCVKDVKGISYKVSLNGKANSDIYVKEDKVFFRDKVIYDINEKRNLLGEYNLNNIMFALGVSEILGLDINKTAKTIRNFKTLEHRLEFVGKYNDVLYYDNSIATVPIATIEAIKALGNVDTLIIGGMDRGVDYSEFIEYLNLADISNIICMPKTGHDIARSLKEEKTYIVENLEDAVDIAKKVTKKGKSCLLSPAAASYGFFKNFEEKGNVYKKLVREV